MNLNDRLHNDEDQFLKELGELKGRIRRALTKGKITKSQYQILNNTISYYEDMVMSKK